MCAIYYVPVVEEMIAVEAVIELLEGGSSVVTKLQSMALHWMVCDSLSLYSAAPRQFLPFPEGTGLRHMRERVVNPPLHDLLHVPHDVQSVQPPSTLKIKD